LIFFEENVSVSDFIVSMMNCEGCKGAVGGSVVTHRAICLLEVANTSKTQPSKTSRDSNRASFKYEPKTLPLHQSAG